MEKRLHQKVSDLENKFHLLPYEILQRNYELEGFDDMFESVDYIMPNDDTLAEHEYVTLEHYACMLKRVISMDYQIPIKSWTGGQGKGYALYNNMIAYGDDESLAVIEMVHNIFRKDFEGWEHTKHKIFADGPIKEPL